MTKEELIVMGLTEEQTKKVLDSVHNNFVEKSKLQEIETENKTLKQSVAGRDKQLETLKKSIRDNEKLKKQIEELQKQNTEQKKTHDAEMAQLKLDNAVEAALLAAGAKNTKAVRSLLEADKLKLAEDGTVEGLKEQLTEVQKSDSYLFTEAKSGKQTFKGFQPGASGGAKPGTRVDMSKMSYEELTAYIENNPDVE